MLGAVRQGLGIASLPCFAGDAEEGLVRYMDPLENLTMDLWVLTHPDLRRTARVSKLVKVLAETLKKHSDQFEGNTPHRDN